MAGSGSDEIDPGSLASLGEIAIFGKEAIARMDGVRTVGQHGTNDRWNVEVTFLGSGGPDTDGLVRHAHVQRILVGGGVDRDRPDAQFPASADNPDGNRATVSHQQFLKHTYSPPEACMPRTGSAE